MMPVYSRRRVFAAACLGMLAFGVVLTALGAVLPSVIERFGIDKSQAGSLLSIMSIGILAGSVVFGPVVDRYGYKALLMFCLGLIVIGLEGIAFAPSFGLLGAACLVIGFGGGVINGGTNALVADISADGRSAGLSLLGVFFGVGAFGVPFVLGLLLDRFDYTAIVAGIGAAVALPLVYSLMIAFPAPKQAQGFPIRDALRLTRDPTLLLFGLVLFFESGMEITVGGWTATFVSEELALDPQQSLQILSVYWLGMVAARLVLGWLLRRISPAVVLVASIGIALVGSLTMIASATLATAAIGSFLIGAGFAAVFPVILGFVGDRYAALSGTAFSLVLVMALMGGTLLPYLTGVLGEDFGLRASFVIVPVSLCAMALVFGLASRRRSAEPAAAS